MRKILIIIFILGLILIPLSEYTNLKGADNDIKPLLNNLKQNKETSEVLHQNVIITLLQPYTSKAINSYYEKYLTFIPREDPWFIKVMDVSRLPGGSGFNFNIKLEVSPYIGPHNSVGIDHITYKVKPSGEVTIEKFEHIKSFPISPNYQNIIKTWPPN